MGFMDNFKNKQFWVEVLKLAVIFFVLFMGFSTLIAHFSDVFSGNFAAIYEEEWANGKWVYDVTVKGIISIIYAIYMVNRRMNVTSNQQN